jgi:O-antigen ligase
MVAASRTGRARWGALALALLLACALAWSLPSRTALLIIVFTVLAASVHQWRAHRIKLAAALAVTVLGSALALAALPAVRERLALGVTELQQAQAGEISKASWGIRFHMLRQTSRMVQDRPWTGWGIGSWNSQWKQRMPPESWGFNMPHNDFLWAGAQAGLPGSLALLALVLAGVRQGWRRRDLTGRLGMVAGLTLLLAASTNSAMRDAAIGLSLVWVVGLVLRLAAEPDDAVTEVIARRSGLD